MPKIVYNVKKFTPAHRKIINKANEFLEDFAKGGFQVTLRTLYYKFVKSNLIPNTEQDYKRLGRIVGEARLAGLIDWEHLEDRMRNLDRLSSWASPQESLTWLSRIFHIDMWKDQPYRPEVWIEKDALSGIIRGVCEENDVPFFCCRGYTSLSEMWRASMRLRSHEKGGQKPHIIHLGDHDPSGMDMSRDIEERLTRTFNARCTFRRVALNIDQIEAFKCPPNPAKVTDARFKKYKEEFGEKSWELDALEPPTIRQLIEEQINAIRDEAQWKIDEASHRNSVEQLRYVAAEWTTIPTQRDRIIELEDLYKVQVKHANSLTQKIEVQNSRIEGQIELLAKKDKLIGEQITQLKLLKGRK